MSNGPHQGRRLCLCWPRKRYPTRSAKGNVPPGACPMVPLSAQWSVEQAWESSALPHIPPIVRVQIYRDGAGRWPQ